MVSVIYRGYTFRIAPHRNSRYAVPTCPNALWDTRNVVNNRFTVRFLPCPTIFEKNLGQSKTNGVIAANNAVSTVSAGWKTRFLVGTEVRTIDSVPAVPSVPSVPLSRVSQVSQTRVYRPY